MSGGAGQCLGAEREIRSDPVGLAAAELRSEFRSPELRSMAAETGIRDAAPRAISARTFGIGMRPSRGEQECVGGDFGREMVVEHGGRLAARKAARCRASCRGSRRS
jgi:hypothetical protein